MMQQQATTLPQSVLEWLLGHMVRDTQVFSQAKAHVKPSHFNCPGELAYSIIWQETLRYVDEVNQLPGLAVLSMRVDAAMSQLVNALEPDIVMAAAVVHWMWGNDWSGDDAFTPQLAIKAMQDFLLDREVATDIRAAAQADFGKSVRELPDILNAAYEKTQRIRSLGIVQRTRAFSDPWETDTSGVMPTGIEMIDERMSGGSKPGEVHVLLGPMGVGKTTLGMQIAHSMARLAYDAECNGSNARRWSAFLSYEDDMQSCRIRAISLAARIHRDRLDNMQSFDELTRTGGDLEPYELELFRNKSPIPGEYERLQAERYLDNYLQLFDCSGRRRPGEPLVGAGGISEAKALLDQRANDLGDPPGCCVLDWAGTIVRKQLEAEGGDLAAKMTSELAAFVGRAHQEIAIPFNCSVWVLHQVRGQMARRGPGTSLHHGDAEQCSMFAANAFFAFVLGNKDDHTHTCTFKATKTRRGPATSQTICKIRGELGRIDDAHREYKLDRLTGRIVLRAMSNNVGDNDDEARESAAPARRPHQPVVVPVDQDYGM